MTTSKPKQFCETSFRNGKLSAELTASYQCVLQFFHSICVKFCHAKVMTWQSAAPVTQNHLPKTEALMLQNAALSGNQCPDLLTSLMNMSLVLRLPRKMHLCRSSSNVPRLLTFLKLLQLQKPLRFAHFWQGAKSLVPATRNGIWTPKSAACFAPHGVHFFSISTSKSAPTLSCFVHVDFEMCFPPQRRGLFHHLNFQKCSEHGVLCTFFVSKCAYRHNGVHFFEISTSKVLREWCALYVFTSKCASRHNGVHFFHIATSKSGPNVKCFLHFDFHTCFASRRRAIFHLASSHMAPHPPL